MSTPDARTSPDGSAPAEEVRVAAPAEGAIVAPVEAAVVAPKPKPKPAPAPKAKAPEKKPVVAELSVPASTSPSAAEVARIVRRQRARRLGIALAVWVGLPSVLGFVYFQFLAVRQYESVTTLVMASDGDRAAVSATLLREHMLSRDTFETLEREKKLSAHYQNGGDFLSRMSAGAGSESRYSYFLDRVDARYEPSSRVFTLRVRAYGGEYARGLAVAMLARGRAFVERSFPDQPLPFFVVAEPSLPDDATFPRRAYGTLTVFLAAVALFAIGSLLVAAVREHAQF